jgi:hypothetical protein
MSIDRPVHREQCPCGKTYIGARGEIWRMWVDVHAKHWEERDE